MFVVDLCIRIHGYHQLNFHQPVHDHHPNGLCDSLRMEQMVSPKFILRAEFVSLEKGRVLSWECVSVQNFQKTQNYPEGKMVIFQNFNRKGVVLGYDCSKNHVLITFAGPFDNQGRWKTSIFIFFNLWFSKIYFWNFFNFYVREIFFKIFQVQIFSN